jgi:hypothetical protein
MKRRRTTSTQSRCNTPSATRSMQTSQDCPLLLLPLELRVLILQYLLYSSEPLGMKFVVNNDRSKHLLVRPNKRTFTFCPAILCVSKQVQNEGYEILYHQNTATATISLDSDDEHSTVECLDNLIPFDGRIACRFTTWNVTIKLNIQPLHYATNVIYDFVSVVLRANPNLNKLKVQLKLWDYPESRKFITFVNPHDFDDIAERILRPFSIIRVKQADFVDKQGIHVASSLSKLMTSDTAPPPITLHELFDNPISFLHDSLPEQSFRVVKARLPLLELACSQYDVDAFRSILRLLLKHLNCRALMPPQHLVEFAQDSAPAVIDM